jgi:hypothetical protein
VRVFRAGQNYYKLLLVKAALGYLGPLVALIVSTAAAAAPSIAPAVRTVVGHCWRCWPGPSHLASMVSHLSDALRG